MILTLFYNKLGNVYFGVNFNSQRYKYYYQYY